MINFGQSVFDMKNQMIKFTKKTFCVSGCKNANWALEFLEKLLILYDK